MYQNGNHITYGKGGYTLRVKGTDQVLPLSVKGMTPTTQMFQGADSKSTLLATFCEGMETGFQIIDLERGDLKGVFVDKNARSNDEMTKFMPTDHCDVVAGQYNDNKISLYDSRVRDRLVKTFEAQGMGGEVLGKDNAHLIVVASKTRTNTLRLKFMIGDKLVGSVVDVPGIVFSAKDVKEDVKPKAECLYLDGEFYVGVRTPRDMYYAVIDAHMTTLRRSGNCLPPKDRSASVCYDEHIGMGKIVSCNENGRECVTLVVKLGIQNKYRSVTWTLPRPDDDENKNKNVEPEVHTDDEGRVHSFFVARDDPSKFAVTIQSTTDNSRKYMYGVFCDQPIDDDDRFVE